LISFFCTHPPAPQSGNLLGKQWETHTILSDFIYTAYSVKAVFQMHPAARGQGGREKGRRLGREEMPIRDGGL